ncbi:hypothetical protein LEMLEM_LOCUS6586 [Lemmus lemmus]
MPNSLSFYYKRKAGLSGGDDLPTRTCLSQRISFIPLQRRKRGNTKKSAWCRAQFLLYGCEVPRML